jgi:phospholipid/cholesterol/gamma-HCH transport system substrate-binding protein
MKQVAEGEGTIGKLLHDDSVYNGLLNTNAELNDLVKDIQVHPE